MPTLDEEAQLANELLLGKRVRKVWRHRERELVVDFEQNARLFVDGEGPLDLSITCPDGDEDAGGCLLELSGAEAIVLFEFLQRFTAQSQLTLEHPAEQRALWNLFALLEKNLTAPLRNDWASLLMKSRAHLVDPDF